MKTYTVIGIYEDNHQRYADVVKATSPEEAEELVLADAKKRCEGDLVIAAVIEGDAKVVA